MVPIVDGLPSNTGPDVSAATVLLLGCNGQLGCELHRALPALGQMVAFDYPEIDFSRPETLRVLVRDVRPGVVVNAAAYTAVDNAESEQDKARAINAEAPGVLAEECERLGAIFVHYSTDYVFDGTKPAAYVETDATNPLSVYGLTKRDGELAAARCRRHLVFRTSWVVGVHGKNFIRTMLRLAAERETLRVVDDQVGAPTSVDLLAGTTLAVLSQVGSVGADDRPWGLYHLTAAGETSWNGLARRVIARATGQGMALRVKPENVAPISTFEYPTPAKRPANSRLDTTKLRSVFGLVPSQWAEGVDAIVDQIVKECGI